MKHSRPRELAGLPPHSLVRGPGTTRLSPAGSSNPNLTTGSRGGRAGSRTASVTLCLEDCFQHAQDTLWGRAVMRNPSELWGAVSIVHKSNWPSTGNGWLVSSYGDFISEENVLPAPVANYFPSNGKFRRQSTVTAAAAALTLVNAEPVPAGTSHYLVCSEHHPEPAPGTAPRDCPQHRMALISFLSETTGASGIEINNSFLCCPRLYYVCILS